MMVQYGTTPQPQKVVVVSQRSPMLSMMGSMSEFPDVSYFSIGGLLIIFGLLHTAIGIAAIVLFFDMSCTLISSTGCSVLLGLSCLIGVGILFTIAGCIGVCAGSCQTGYVRAGLKSGFLVLCILSAVVAVIALVVLSNYLAMPGIMDTMLALSAVATVGAVIVFFLTVVGAAIACCCSPVEMQ